MVWLLWYQSYLKSNPRFVSMSVNAVKNTNFIYFWQVALIGYPHKPSKLFYECKSEFEENFSDAIYTYYLWQKPCVEFGASEDKRHLALNSERLWQCAKDWRKVLCKCKRATIRIIWASLLAQFFSNVFLLMQLFSYLAIDCCQNRSKFVLGSKGSERLKCWQ